MGCFSPRTQPRDEVARFWKYLFESGRKFRVATVAHRLERRIDLIQRPLGHVGVSAPFSDNRQQHALRA